jgi:membrane protease YdiL (CAAX protease family)
MCCAVRGSPSGRPRGSRQRRLDVEADTIVNRTIQAVLAGMLVAMAGTIPRNILFALNLRYGAGVAWAVPATAAYLWLFWRYVSGSGPPPGTARCRRTSLRARAVPPAAWCWSLSAGTVGIVALVIALRLVNRLVLLPPQTLSDMANTPRLTVLMLLLAAAPVAGIIEEAAFRGYMQRPIEKQHGVTVAILITGVMFALAHLDFTPVLLPYYVAVSALYGMVAYLTDSILPAIVLHTAGNTFSNLDLWLHGQAEWQAGPAGGQLVWSTGVDTSFVLSSLVLLVMLALTIGAYRQLARVTGRLPRSPLLPQRT